MTHTPMTQAMLDQIEIEADAIIDHEYTQLKLIAALRESWSEVDRLRKFIILLGASPSKRHDYLKEHGARIGPEHGAQTCVDEHWRGLIASIALAPKEPA